MVSSTRPGTPARLFFVRACGMFFVGMIFLILVQGVVLYLDDRLLSNGDKGNYREGDLIAPLAYYWIYGLYKFSVAAWKSVRSPWPHSAEHVPGALAMVAIILTWGLPFIHPHWMPDVSPGWVACYLLGLPILTSVTLYYSSRAWLLGWRPRVKIPRPYAAASAYKSSDGKPLWGYRLIFHVLGWALTLASLLFLLDHSITAILLLSLGLASFWLWRELQSEHFTPRIWRAGWWLLIALGGSSLLLRSEWGIMGSLFFVFCIINWAAPTAKDLFFRRPAAAEAGLKAG